MTVALMVQARMGGERLPDKVALPILGKPMLWYQLMRLGEAKLVDEFIVATDSDYYNQVTKIAVDSGWKVYQGPSINVLSRYAGAAHFVGADLIIRATGDAPLQEASTADLLVERFVGSAWDHLGIDGLPDGQGMEIFPTSLLEYISKQPDLTDEDKEHVTTYVRRQPQRFSVGYIWTRRKLDHLRWTVDYEEDFQLIKTIIEELWPTNPNFTMDDVIAFLDAHPYLYGINSNIPEGKIEQGLRKLRKDKGEL